MEYPCAPLNKVNKVRLSGIKNRGEAQGRAAWLWLHAEASAGRLTEARLEDEFTPMIPSFGCTCLSDWKAFLVTIPFRAIDQFAWSVDVHNAVNVKLGKPIWSESVSVDKDG